MQVTATAPSNIALIKYAGKKDNRNLPINPSLSYTLDHLITTVQIQPVSDLSEDCWKPLDTKDFFPLNLSQHSVDRYLKFFQFLKDTFKIPGVYQIRSGNNFPAEAGVASSASSFCALTLATYQLAKHYSMEKTKLEGFGMLELSALSRQGSGSSCRSFFRPWSLWEGDKAHSVNLSLAPLIHQLVVVNAGAKSVSSSESHKRILTSPFFKGRVERVKNRLTDLLKALNGKDWQQCFEITWAEFQDLHQLYESANPSVVYRTEESHKVLNWLKEFWDKQGDGPLVTMDAGPHVHLLYRSDQKSTARKIKKHFSSDFQVLSSE